MMFFSEYIAPILLAILQGITEFLPVSSSGHLVLLNSIMPTDSGLLFDLVLHLATLVSVCAFYRREIASIFVGCIDEIRHPVPKTNLRFVGYLLAATFITGAIGLCVKDVVENEMRSMLVVGILLIGNAGILWLSQKRGWLKMSEGELNLKTAVILGLCQGLAVLPGISRSGTTITAALIMGIASKDCAKISFLLSIPVILGAVVLHIPEMGSIQGGNVGIVLISAATAAVVGYVSLVVLEKVLKKANFHYFASYCFGIGLLAAACHFILGE